MTKKGLKTGMLVQHRNGQIALLINEYFCYKNGGFNELSSVKNDLTFTESDSNYDYQWDIIKVSKVLDKGYLSPINWDERTFEYNLLWSREEPEEMTIEQIEKELGKKIKIIS